MARHLIIGNGGTANISTSTGLEVNNAISIQKLSADGPTNLVLGDSIADAPQIRFVQGTVSGPNIYSPWIYGRDVVDYSGLAYSAPVACSVTNTIAATSAAAGTLVLKFVRVGGPAPEFFSFATEIGASIAHTDADLLVKAAYEAADLPDWLNKECDATAGATVVFSGALRGDVAQSGNTWEYDPPMFELIVESYDGGTQTHTASSTTGAFPGFGSGFNVRNMEENNRGTGFGFYNRLELPNTPTATSVTGTNYDSYQIVATKDGSSASQIRGVDNLIEVTAVTTAGNADSLVFENLLNGYFAGKFANVIL